MNFSDNSPQLNFGFEGPADRMNYLRAIIREYDRAYYIEAMPLVSDREYDLLFRELQELEEKYPQLRTEDSPTQRVGGEPIKGFVTVEHEKQMLSLANTYSVQEILDFMKRAVQGLENEDIQYVTELKYDGVAVSLRYKDCKLNVALSRGDGIRGDDITHNIRTIRSIPLEVKPIKIDGNEIRDFEVRGEVYMLENDFIKINELRTENGEAAFANPRNTTAGTLKMLDSRIVAGRPLKMTAYYLDTNEIKPRSHWENLDVLRQMGFPVSPYSALCNDSEDVMKFIEKWNKGRYELPFQIDGIVIKINSIRQQDILGSIARSPRWAVAYKYEAETAETLLKSISLQVGRTGIVTPVAELDPVFLAGSTVSRATLHNADFIAEKDIRVGDYVLVQKGGEVIPKIIAYVPEKRKADSIRYEFPSLCPCEIESELVRQEGESAWLCVHPDCPWQVRRRIEHFASRNAMDIEGLGEKAVDQLVENNLIQSIADIFSLKDKRNELIKLDGWAAKSIDKLMEAIEKCKSQAFNRVLYGIGIRFIGEGAAKILARNFRNISELAEANIDLLKSIHEIGDKMAESVVSFFIDENNIKLIEALAHSGVNLESGSEFIVSADSPFNGKIIVLTGELKSLTRNQAQEKIESMGGRVSSSVSKKTDFVLIGDNPGSKYNKALELGVQIMNEDEFMKLIE
jgi:DNA ligase (NAD+)